MENRAIIIEYLLHYCHKDSAKALLKEMRMLDSCSDSIQNKDSKIKIKINHAHY